MFHLLSGLWQYAFHRDEYYVLIVGLDKAGKTTLLEKFKKLHRADYVGIPLERITTTVGLNVGRVDVSNIRLIFWDLGGQPELHELWDNYYGEAHGIIFVIDSSDPTRLQESKEAFDKMISNDKLRGLPLLVLCNKQDVPGAMSVVDIKQVFNDSAPKLGQRDCKVQRVSAITGENIKESLEWMAHCVQRNPSRPPVSRGVH